MIGRSGPTDAIINLNKPQGISSAQALYRVRKVTGVRKSGHAGTLDPAADGVLVLCLGKTTRLVELIMNQPKVYRAVARLDATSESFDSARPLLPVSVSEPPLRERIEAALRAFEGESQQVPPSISAVKVGGLPAYRRVLKGQSPELKARPVQIYWIHLHAYEWPTLDFEMACGRGTYVRAVVRDLGQRLGTGGVLTKLARLRVGPFTICTSIGLQELCDFQMPISDSLRAPWLIPIDEVRRLLETTPTIPPPLPKGD
ncbi:MAG TPA: tRNA pseudouridine(55) synthase TruB [Phycisphaerae bacterium]